MGSGNTPSPKSSRFGREGIREEGSPRRLIADDEEE